MRSSKSPDRDWIITSSNNTLNWMRTACFYCAAVLRLATKDHVALLKAWSGLSHHYQSFYGAHLEFDISLDTFQDLDGQKDQGICKSLFENHLRYTGLYAYTLFISNATRLAVPHHVFQDVLRHPASAKPLATIMEILKSYENPSLDEDDRKSKCTWVYSRIFDSDMFADLQTQRCMFFAALLAVLADTIGGSSSSASSGGGSGQASNIKQLEGFIHQNQDKLHLFAGRMITFCNEFNQKNDSTNKSV